MIGLLYSWLKKSGLLSLLALVCHSAYAKPTEIDLMVVYSESAVTHIGGAQAMERAVNYAVLNANTIYRNNGVNQRLRLVHTAPVGFREGALSNTEDAVVAVEKTSDGHADEIHGLRNQYGADLVMVVVDGSPWPDWTGGDAHVLYQNNLSLSEYAAFSLVGWEFLEVGLAFPHELGHSMGLHHDWYVSADELTPYPYARGHVNAEAGWRTIMAYDNECKAKGKTCPRIGFFSSPRLSYQGQSLGVAEGTNTGCRAGSLDNPPCDADASKTLNNTAATVAAFRPSVVDNALGVAEPLSPLGTLQTYTPVFSWKPVPNATRYRLWVGIAPASGTAVDALQNGKAILVYQWYEAKTLCTTTLCSVKPGVNFSNANHYWSVQAHNASGWGLWSDVRDFTLYSADMTGGPEVVPLFPSATTTGGRPTFYWLPAHGGGGAPAATQYSLLAWSMARNQIVYLTPWYDAAAVCNQSVCAATPPDALATGDYLWRIRSNSLYGEGANGTRLYFSANSAVCSGSGNTLESAGSAYVLTLRGLCFQGTHYPRETSLQFNLDGSWQVVGQVDVSAPSAPCPAGSNRLDFGGSYFSLDAPNFCHNGSVQPIAGSFRLNLNGSWGFVPR